MARVKKRTERTGTSGDEPSVDSSGGGDMELQQQQEQLEKDRKQLEEDRKQLEEERAVLPEEIERKKEELRLEKKKLREEQEKKDAEIYISYHEAGRILNRAPSTIRRWALEGLIATIREPTGRRRIKKSDLKQFVEGSNLEGDFNGG